MNGFVLSGRIHNIERRLTANGSNIYKVVIEDSDCKAQYPKKIEVTLVGNMAKSFKEFMFAPGTSVVASGVLDSYERGQFINLCLTALTIIPLNKNGFPQEKAMNDGEQKEEEQTLSATETEVSEDDLPF